MGVMSLTPAKGEAQLGHGLVGVLLARRDGARGLGFQSLGTLQQGSGTSGLK